VRIELRHLVTGRSARRSIARLRYAILYLIAALLVVAAITAILYLVRGFPHWQALISSIKDPKDRISLENEIFRTFIQFLGGAFFLLGVYFTWRNFRLAQEGQITQRFNDAIEHLGSEKPEVRLGGIYALARIARDSPKDHMSVMNVFCTYVREATKRAPAEPATPEVQAILTMIARRTVEHESDDDRIDLSGAYLPGVNLTGAQLERVCFDGTDLSRATLERALLRGAALRGAVLEDAYLRYADLRDTDLTGADLRAASLRKALLDGANIFGAKLDGAILLNTNMSSVKNAIKRQVEDAITDETTVLPVYDEVVP
jgi:hypothetical protein